MVEDANAFAWGTAMDYLGRHFPRFLRAHWDYIRDRGFDSLDSLLSLRARSLFVFFKYYLHRQAPGRSDFFDFLHVSYAPYCDVFVTERNVCNVLTIVSANSRVAWKRLAQGQYVPRSINTESGTGTLQIDGTLGCSQATFGRF